MDPSETERISRLRAPRLSPGLICFILGLLGTLPLVVLTPPFQVPDESQHFLRAYQLSELDLTGIVEDGGTKAILPSSLIELVERFLGTREVLVYRSLSAQPVRRTWLALDRPLNPGRRELVTVEYTTYPPLAYLPQVIAIAAGRWLGMGPLLLLYLGRLASALAAVAVLAWAVRVMPLGAEMAMLLGLLPMAVYEYASVSPDAAVITTAFLFTAVAVRAQLRGRWSGGDIALAVVSGLVFCGQKPVYAPLLLVGLPAPGRGRTQHVVLVHAAIIAIVLGGAVAWLWFAAPRQSVQPGSSIAGQAAFITAHPLAYCRILLVTVLGQYLFYKSTVGALGWLTLSLPGFAYMLPLGGFLLATLAQSPAAPKLPAMALPWNALLIAGSGILIMTAAYLVWNTVAAARIEVVQGRYFLPLLALAAATWCSVGRVPLSPQRRLAALLTLVLIVVAEQVTTDLTIVRAYQVF